jgi:hypothetical protein
VQLFSDPDMPDVVCIEHLTSALYLDNREDAGHYTQVTNYLGTEALPPPPIPGACWLRLSGRCRVINWYRPRWLARQTAEISPH